MGKPQKEIPLPLPIAQQTMRLTKLFAPLTHLTKGARRGVSAATNRHTDLVLERRAARDGGR